MTFSKTLDSSSPFSRSTDSAFNACANDGTKKGKLIATPVCNMSLLEAFISNVLVSRKKGGQNAQVEAKQLRRNISSVKLSMTTEERSHACS